MQSSEDLGNTFGRSWELLSQNWIIVVPGVVVGILAAVVLWVLAVFGIGAAAGFGAMGMGVASYGAMMMGAAVMAIVLIIATLINVAYTTGMAGAAWSTGKAALDDGAAAFSGNAGSLLTAMIVLFLLGLVAGGLSIFTFGLAMLAFAIFFLYTFASVIIGRNSGTEALAESCRLAARNFGTTLIIVILLAIAALVGGFIGRVFHGIPVLGPAIGYVIMNVVGAYAALVVVGEYNKLRTPVTPVGVGTSGP